MQITSFARIWHHTDFTPGSFIARCPRPWLKSRATSLFYEGRDHSDLVNEPCCASNFAIYHDHCRIFKMKLADGRTLISMRPGPKALTTLVLVSLAMHSSLIKIVSARQGRVLAVSYIPIAERDLDVAGSTNLSILLGPLTPSRLSSMHGADLSGLLRIRHVFHQPWRSPTSTINSSVDREACVGHSVQEQ